MFCTCMIVVYYSHRKGKRLVMVKKFIGTRYELRLRKTEVLCEIDFTPIAIDRTLVFHTLKTATFGSWICVK